MTGPWNKDEPIDFGGHTPRPDKRPCAGCGGRKPIYTDGDLFFKWDAERNTYRAVNYKGDFYPLDTHPATTEVQLVRYYREQGKELRVATEYDILWRTFALVIDVLVVHKML